MHAFLISTLVVAIAEIGDKTQLLAMLLASRFKKPVPILCGILVATLANHALAALAGQWVGEVLAGPWLRWVLGFAFLAMAAWVLVPDRIAADAPPWRRASTVSARSCSAPPWVSSSPISRPCSSAISLGIGSIPAGRAPSPR